jgi:hypothetical protein
VADASSVNVARSLAFYGGHCTVTHYLPTHEKILYRRVLWLGQAGICSFARLFFEQIRHPSVDPVRRCVVRVASDPNLSSFGSGAVRMLKLFRGQKLSFGIWRSRHYRQHLFSRTRQDSVVYASSFIYPFQDIVLTPITGRGWHCGHGWCWNRGSGTHDPIPLPSCFFFQ